MCLPETFTQIFKKLISQNASARQLLHESKYFTLANNLSCIFLRVVVYLLIQESVDRLC